RTRRKCYPVRDGARAGAGHSRRIQRGDEPGRAKIRKAEDANSGAPALPNRLLRRIAGSVPPRCLWLGQQSRQGAGPRTGAAAEDPPARKQRRHQAIRAEGAGTETDALTPSPRAGWPRIISRAAEFRHVAFVGEGAEIGEAALEAAGLLARASVPVLGNDHARLVVRALHIIFPFRKVRMVVGGLLGRQVIVLAIDKQDDVGVLLD